MCDMIILFTSILNNKNKYFKPYKTTHNFDKIDIEKRTFYFSKKPIYKNCYYRIYITLGDRTITPPPPP